MGPVSSAGQSTGFLNRGSEVRVLYGTPQTFPSLTDPLTPKRADADQEAVAAQDQGGPGAGAEHEGQD